ncbi:hypothetical protein B0H11DRAFT_1919888 [Mycena galericulata]|nr:hypothetical protein B0H11DRAFT_1943765 [Mycena galericulata]KAJ7471344.1 hypothetical protein B0H11DRAFT_1919888 [Mycena galericulata]
MAGSMSGVVLWERYQIYIRGRRYAPPRLDMARIGLKIEDLGEPYMSPGSIEHGDPSYLGLGRAKSFKVYLVSFRAIEVTPVGGLIFTSTTLGEYFFSLISHDPRGRTRVYRSPSKPVSYGPSLLSDQRRKTVCVLAGQRILRHRELHRQYTEEALLASTGSRIGAFVYTPVAPVDTGPAPRPAAIRPRAAGRSCLRHHKDRLEPRKYIFSRRCSSIHWPATQYQVHLRVRAAKGRGDVCEGGDVLPSVLVRARVGDQRVGPLLEAAVGRECLEDDGRVALCVEDVEHSRASAHTWLAADSALDFTIELSENSCFSVGDSTED